ncbi:unnamed protein product [Phytophthora fragariaefolia]|uniref:Unnamed protein product n=1 Tax=Phytophthora fragariaefolia TaxID=1490495 RepID=A0A9W6YNB4_9STRA|nr:unnamed protein product [Phytophthora fragariaefolia]
MLKVAPPKVETALVSPMKCTYCHRDNHDTIDCYILQRHLHNGQVKRGTVLPTNFKVNPQQQPQRPHPYKGNYNGKGVNKTRNNNKGLSNGNRNNHGKPYGRNKFHDRQKRDNDSNDVYGTIAITTLNLSQEPKAVGLTALETDHDPMWAVDSGCTRHVTSSSKWFETLKPTAGKAITAGGNHQIPIMGTGDVKMKIKDTKGKERIVILIDVLYAPGVKFNLLLAHQAVGNDFKINFPNAKKCVLFFAHRVKFEAKTRDGKFLYQFQAKTTDSDQAAHVTTSGTSDNILLWHKRMGHPNFRIIHDLAKANTITDMTLSKFDPKQGYLCSSCTYTKSPGNPFNKHTVERARFPREKVHTDMGGPQPVPTLSGCQLFLTFIDDYTLYMFIYIIKRKSDLYESYEDFRKKAQNISRAEVGEIQYHEDKQDEEIKYLQSDNAREYEKLVYHLSEIQRSCAIHKRLHSTTKWSSREARAHPS